MRGERGSRGRDRRETHCVSTSGRYVSVMRAEGRAFQVPPRVVSDAVSSVSSAGSSTRGRDGGHRMWRFQELILFICNGAWRNFNNQS